MSYLPLPILFKIAFLGLFSNSLSPPNILLHIPSVISICFAVKQQYIFHAHFFKICYKRLCGYDKFHKGSRILGRQIIEKKKNEKWRTFKLIIYHCSKLHELKCLFKSSCLFSPFPMCCWAHLFHFNLGGLIFREYLKLEFKTNGCISIILLFSCSVVSDSLRLHGLQHARFLFPSLSPGVCSNSCPLSWWCHPTIPPSVALFSFCSQSFQASGSFPVSRPFASGCQSIAASASASFFPMNIQGWFPLGLTG